MTRVSKGNICPECGAPIPTGFESCTAVFDEVCAREYGDPGYGAAHLLTVGLIKVTRASIYTVLLNLRQGNPPLHLQRLIDE